MNTENFEGNPLAPVMHHLFATILLGFFFHGASSDEVVIDEQPQEKWAWTPKKPTIQMQNGKFATGWERATGERAYTVCDVDVDKEPNNWLYSGYINVEEAQKVDITVTYHMANPCNDGKKCKTFKVVFYGYVMESDTSVDVARMPNPLTNRSLYRNISSFNLRTPGTKTTVIIPLSVKTKYIVLAFHDQGACAYLYSVKVSYNVCGKRTLVQRLVSLPRTIAPVNESLLVKGTCAPNSLQDGSLIVACDRYGEWNSSSLEGRCECEEGKENNKGICTDCPSGKYVDQKGNNCTGLPSAPQSANFTFVNETTVEIRWQPPAVTGESTRVFYEVICHKVCSTDSNNCVEEDCGSGSFIPSAEVNKTRVIATNLSPDVNYAFKIYARNRVSKVAQHKYGVEGNFSKITVRTLGTVPGKPDVSVEPLEDTVEVSWTLKRKNGAIIGYHVIYIRDDDPTDRTNLTTKNMTQSFEDLTAGKTYEFQVYAVNNFGKGPKGVKKFTVPKGLYAVSCVTYPITATLNKK